MIDHDVEAETNAWYRDPATLETDLKAHARWASRELFRSDPSASSLVSPVSLRTLTALYRLERSTIERMRVLLVTPTHSDAQVTAFLCTWAYERHWIAETLADVLESQGVDPTLPTWSGGFVRRTLAEANHRLVPIVEAVRTNVVGDPVVALHLVQGLVEETFTMAAYRGALDLDPGLAGLIAPVLGVKALHARYFELRARQDLSGSDTVGRWARRRLLATRWPSRSPILTIDDATVLIELLKHRPLDLAPITQLPGLAGLTAVARPGAHRVRFDSSVPRS